MTTKKDTHKPLLTQDRLRELLDYNPDTGVFKWKNRPNRQPERIVNCAGSVNPKGYRRIQIDGIPYYAHRLAFLWVVGFMPKVVDHIDRNRQNNSFNNLRPATTSENNANSEKRKSTNNPYKGCSYKKKKNKWVAYISINGVCKHLGYYDTPEEAAQKYNEEAGKRWKGFANGSKL